MDGSIDRNSLCSLAEMLGPTDFDHALRHFLLELDRAVAAIRAATFARNEADLNTIRVAGIPKTKTA